MSKHPFATYLSILPSGKGIADTEFDCEDLCLNILVPSEISFLFLKNKSPILLTMLER